MEETAFPDANFEAELIATGIPNVDGKINPKDAATKKALEAITELDVEQKFISDLAGIEYLPNLKNLNCSFNSLTSLNVSANKALKACG